ncbi:MAG: uracil-DNA glycosylase family protein [Acholeplasmatales bacterium]|jgi:uracil-DNA glycosylase|nr:uracil-DNA glycosylase family protein [Acholeplasmataceae bacterium]MDY0115594.1 uracil-DNA glycosylase family protein [Acholeplasmatales bacterium]MCK9234399.1 uracil-DNA glycosylase family protein [Acholeplasmataceae bacterium]MCK9289204.1 uracil-DNA glycosylase family protein [Acholeplasmataceae bacterium]MCK9427690.1 uracil-DNA glycosylase family protein [Acholeplasmataceae bacterium]
MATNFKNIYKQIINDKDNLKFTEKEIFPLYQAGPKAKILIIGQAPGIKAQTKMKLFADESGKRLREWLNVTDEVFYNENIFAILPMDFYFPGAGKTGDLPPRKQFASQWHPALIESMKELKLIILIGNYPLKYYLKDHYQTNLTITVRNYQDYLPKYFPLVHPSPRNFRWHKKNNWFIKEVIPALQSLVKSILESK